MSPRSREEIKVYGEHACRALFERRPDDLLRVYLTEDRLKRFGDVLRHCARLRRPYRVVPAEELAAITESTHHEGICVVARPPEPARLEDVVRRPGAGMVLGLVDVANPHNVGAILRTAAHFGARAALLVGEPGRLGPAAYRTAQGGAEWLDLVFERNLARAVRVCRAAGFTVGATTNQGGRPLFSTALPPRLLLLLGAEDVGLPASVLGQADLVLRVPGTGHVESLNVAAAAAVLVAEHWRQHGGGERSTKPRARGPIS
jgi:RNA methyltransferase, TrmH family